MAMDEGIEPTAGPATGPVTDRGWDRSPERGDLPTPPAAGRARPDYEEVLVAAGKLLDDVERALARLDEGTYDACEGCGARIGESRLTEHPTARPCALHHR